MATIPAGTKFIGIGASVPTPENKSSQNNGFQEVYTIEDVLSYDNATSGLTATDYQAAIDELVANPQTGYTETIVNISSAQILAMGTTPIQLLPAPGAGKYYDIQKIILEYTHVTTPYANIAGTDDLAFEYGGDSTMFPSWVLTQTENSFGVISLTQGYQADVNTSYNTGQVLILNTALRLKTSAATNPTLGDGTMRIIIYSKERTFGA